MPRSGVIEILDAEIAGHTWAVGESLADQSEIAEVFTAEIDAWRRAEVFFGNGKIGIAGNVAPNTITIIRDIAHDSAGNKVSVRVTNQDWASGGADPESLESIKLYAPRFFETQRRCVTQQDYETFATNFNGICKARAIVHEQSGEANVIRLYVLTYGAKNNTVATANQTLKDNLLQYLNKYKMLTDWLEIKDGSISTVDFSGSVRISEGFKIDSVLLKIREAITDFMSIDTRDMGEPLRISDVYALIDNIEGVDFVELNTPLQTIAPADYELLILGSVDFYGAYS